MMIYLPDVWQTEMHGWLVPLLSQRAQTEMHRRTQKTKFKPIRMSVCPTTLLKTEKKTSEQKQPIGWREQGDGFSRIVYLAKFDYICSL